MKEYQVLENIRINLSEVDANGAQHTEEEKEIIKQKTLVLNKELEELQEALYAENKHKILIILQGMDTSGKDGVIRHVFEGVNPQGVRVASFKQPTVEELSHDYLWRIHKQTPKKGEIVIFNRSHYEDVLIVRVHQLVAEHIWKKRYEQIKNFEKMLYEEGTIILKFFLHITKEEQKKRLQARIDDKKKQWKISKYDLEERKYWQSYQEAYEDMLNKTSSQTAPWFIIPSNKKWLRNYIISDIILTKLRELNIQYPQPTENLEGIIIE